MENTEMETCGIEETGIVDMPEDESAETCDSDVAGVIAGAIGGFLAYVVIDGGKKLIRFIAEKRAKRKLAKETVANQDDEAESETQQQDK